MTAGEDTSSDADRLSPDAEEYLTTQADRFDTLAKYTLSLFKINLVILGLFLPIVANLLGGEFNPEKIFNSQYTQVGLIVWLFSSSGLLFAFHSIRQSGEIQLEPIKNRLSGEIPSAEYYFQTRKTVEKSQGFVQRFNWLISICAVLSLLAIGLLSLGALSPYISAKPQSVAIILLFVCLSLAIFILLIRQIAKHGRDLLSQHDQQTPWDQLGKERQEMMKAIYDNFGEEAFTLSDVYNEARSIKLHKEEDQFHMAISSGRANEYLIDRLVNGGYFNEIKRDSDTIRTPTGRDIKTDANTNSINQSIDLLAQRLEGDGRAKRMAAQELNTHPDQVLSQLSEGDLLDVIERYNRIIRHLEQEDVDLEGLRVFEFQNEQTRYEPTKLAKDAFDKIERERDRKRMEIEQMERNEEIRRAENTYRYLVHEYIDEYGTLNVVTHDMSVPNDHHHSLSIPDARVDDEVKNALRELESGDEVRLRVEWDHQYGDYFIMDAPDLP